MSAPGRKQSVYFVDFQAIERPLRPEIGHK